jgi:hypothetical protein
MTSRSNATPNVAYKRTSRGVFVQTAVRSGGGEFSTGTLGNFHPALTTCAIETNHSHVQVLCNIAQTSKKLFSDQFD